MGNAAAAGAAEGQHRLAVAEHQRRRHRRHRPPSGQPAVGDRFAAKAGLEGEIGELIVHHHASHKVPTPENRLHRGGVGGNVAAGIHDGDLAGALFDAPIRPAVGIAIDAWRQSRRWPFAVGALHGSGPAVDVGRIQQRRAGNRAIDGVVHPIEPVGIGPGLGAGQLPPYLRRSCAGAGQVGGLVQQRQALQQR